jgi:hypothetical protein
MNKYSTTALLAALVCALSAQAQSVLISVDFQNFSADQSLFTGAKYDFTNNKVFTLADTTPNTFGVYAGTSTSYVVKADPLDSNNLTLWLNGSANMTNNGWGLYLMRLDPTAGGTYTSGEVSINYSFKMMRDGTNAASPSAFNVLWVSRPASLDNGTENLDMFTWAGEQVHQSFTTSGDSDTWVTVSGSIVADLSTLDLTNPYSTGIRIQATNGGFVSGSGTPGIFYVDNISVSVVPEPSTYALLTGLVMLGVMVVRRRSK